MSAQMTDIRKKLDLEGMTSDDKLLRIKKLVRSDIPPMIMLACILMIVRAEGGLMP